MAEGGRLVRSRAQATEQKPAAGLQTLQLSGSKEAFLYCPKACLKQKHPPALVYLHGAGGRAEDALMFAQMAADHFGFIAVCPSSERTTWDLIVSNKFSQDATNIQECLDFLAAEYSVDYNKLCLCGFSDGASYALSLGLLNGDVFSHIIALSPGFITPGPRNGSPEIFICHGRADKVLHIDSCSRKIVPKLRDMDYDVTYKEFSGPHVVRPDTLRAALKWFLDGKRRERSNVS